MLLNEFVTMSKLLTIAIPTYNRAIRLEKALNDLLSQIIKSEKEKYVSVFVSDNGSTDTTASVINKYSDIFSQNNISYSSHSFVNNCGFDANVQSCYRNCNSEYVWFLSDDDNILDGAIETIIDDIHKHAPSVLYYNFDQDPHNLESPYIKVKKLYKNVDINNIQAIYRIIKWPKLTSLVVRKVDGQAGEKVKNYDLGFMHVALAIQTGLDYGRVFHSNRFIARPDDDYMDHIDFPPYVANRLKETVKSVLLQDNKANIYQQMEIKEVDPLTSSMNTLGAYYRGKFVLSSGLRSELYSTVRNELKNLEIRKVGVPLLVLSTIKLFVSYAYYLGYIVCAGVRTTGRRIMCTFQKYS